MCYFLPRPQRSQSPVNTAGPGGPPLDLRFPSSLTRRALKALRGRHKHFHSKFKSMNSTHLPATAGNPNPNPTWCSPWHPRRSSSSPPRASAAPRGRGLESWLQLLAEGANLHSSIQNGATASSSGPLITPQLTQSVITAASHPTPGRTRDVLRGRVFATSTGSGSHCAFPLRCQSSA